MLHFMNAGASPGTTRSVSRMLTWLVALGCLASLSGCLSSSDDLRVWIRDQKAQAKPRVQPLPAPRKFTPIPYAAAQAVDPYSALKLKAALMTADREPSSILAAQMRRAREPLESYPLDTLSMVGTMFKGKVMSAIIKSDGMLYQVTTGDHLGQNFGRVGNISEAGVEIVEIAQDATGEWVERPTRLELQTGQSLTPNR